MSNSSLVSYTKLSPNHSGQRTHSIDRITPHCVVGQLSAESICGCFTSTSRQASCNYGIGTDGRISLCVEEKNRSWCSSSNANDQRAVTIECASDMSEPYAMNSKVYASLINLCVDICKRNGKKKLLWFGDKTKSLNYSPKSDEMVITVHRWFANKSCPGNWLYARLGDLATQVTNKLGGASSAPAPTPTPSKPSALKFGSGDIVNFAGGTHYTSANAASGFAVKASRAKITAVSASAKHPYHCRAVNASGEYISGVYGWVDANTLSAISSPANSSFGAGTKLTLKNVAIYTSSASTAKAGTKTGTYYVWSAEVVNNKIRITNSTANVGKSGQVTGWISYSDAKNAAGTTVSQSNTFASYRVKVTADVLNIRKGAGTNYGTNGSIRDKGVYTIVAEANGKGATKWGKLKSGAGWISLDYCKKV